MVMLHATATWARTGDLMVMFRTTATWARACCNHFVLGIFQSAEAVCGKVTYYPDDKVLVVWVLGDGEQASLKIE